MRLLAALVAALALVAAGCGGDDEPEAGEATPAEWADGFCTAVSDWTGELERIGETLGDPSSLSVDSIEGAAQEVNDATDAFVTDVRALGAPDTESGEEIQSSLEALADTLEAEKAEIEAAVEDASGISELTGAVATIGASLSAMATAFQTAFEALEGADVGGELETAFEESEACDQLGS